MDISQLNSCLPSPIEEQDRLVSGEISKMISRPEKCPRPFVLTEINQLNNPESQYACVACGASGLRQTASRMQDIFEDCDYIWLYKECKKIDGIPNINGTYLKTVLTVAKNIGIKTTTGKLRKIKEYKKIINPNDQSQMETAIFLYHAVLAAVTLSNNGWKGEIVRMPLPGEPTGGHGIVINGFDLENYLCHDSMPEYHNGKDDFKMPKNYTINEAWVFTVDDDIIDVPDTSIIGWIATDVANTINGNTIISNLNIRKTPNVNKTNIIKTLLPGTTFEVIEKYNGMSDGHTWQEIKI